MIARLRAAPPIALGAVAAWASSAPVVVAHGGTVPAEPPTVAGLLLDWSFDPLVWLPAIAALAAWRILVGRVDRAHPANPVRRLRTASFVAGVAVILLALDSGIERYDTTLFSVHMVQHLLLTLVAPILLLLAAPVTLALRAAPAATRDRWLYPALHSRVARFLAFPVVAWLLFAGVMWGAHFSPLFEAALENEWAHRLEHGLFLGAALLFWWRALGVDPAPSRLGHGGRVLFTGLQMPQNTFLALAILMAPAALYPHYTTTGRTWGPTPLEDQQLAAGIMWIGGDLVFVVALVLLVAAWMRREEQRTAALDRRLDAERAAVRRREGLTQARNPAEP